MKFYKLQSSGNDFVVIFQDLTHKEILRICNPKLGVGCDQLLVLKGTSDVIIYNSDGSDVSFCGNGLRSLAYLQNRLLNRGIFEYSVAGLRYSVRVLDDGSVRLKVGKRPVFISIPETLEQLLNGITGVIGFNMIDIGNRNLVIFFNKKDGIDYFSIKSQITSLGVLQDDLNISFATTMSDGTISTFIIERGAGSTMSCGSSGIATVASAMKNGLIGPGEIMIRQPGGELMHEISKDYEINQIGRSTLVFEGEYFLD